MNSKVDPRQLIAWAKEFRDSEFGRIYLDTVRVDVEETLRKAMFDASTTETKALLVEHAAGLKRSVQYIEFHASMADDPELFKSMYGEEATKEDVKVS